MKSAKTTGMACGASRISRAVFSKSLAGAVAVNLKSFAGESGAKLPVMFVGHGSPMNALQENSNTKGWRLMAEGLKPKAVLCISAHWETRGTRVTMAVKPKTIHDFSGFPPELYAIHYPAPGAPDVGDKIIGTVKKHAVQQDHAWGLDHGAWSVIMKMFPRADVPVLQLSLNRNLSLRDHYALARELAFLRRQGVLVIGSGNLVHNLHLLKWDSEGPYDWAGEFDEQARQLILDGDHASLMRGEALSREAKLSIPTPEHYLPMLYILALQEQGEQVSFFNESIDMGSISMRSMVIN
ncbi:4,5-DOPA dioxygenase extradiol [Pontiella sp.]|uniref:4,5-DOPA-extradiol-dioxygenase n=1 Tax=Pontiella sp. TaxID=2837462 RepID=UPI00356648E4